MNELLVTYVFLVAACLQAIFDFIKEYRNNGWIESERFISRCSQCGLAVFLYVFLYRDLMVSFM